ncbi:hypothetical protein Bhyg_08168 [Pseudolycoriella hygida]|uniref:Uncharacterized protein n=1 Tax=Pseudolycoriella hygida TaxID=35572 RepID=A0A9Q0N514_9DIPT|nr:hypothetical protein Bhyg_08168 [Pseudolycoriella hygida]
MDYRSIFGLILLALLSDCATYMDESDMKAFIELLNFPRSYTP